MNITLHSNAGQATSLFREQNVSIIPQYKRIFAVVAFALSCLALCYYAFRRYCFKAKPAEIKAKSDTFPVTTWNFRKDSTYQPFPQLPEGYNWVTGYDLYGIKNAQNFMEHEEDPHVITAVAGFACANFSPHIPSSLQLHIGSLIFYARTEGQIQAVVHTVADSKEHVRAIFSALFMRISNSESAEDVWKLRWIRDLLSDDQLMSVLALNNNASAAFYQEEQYEIGRIEVHNYLKYQHILNLPEEFIAKCQELSQYEEYVRFEARKEVKEIR